MHEKGYHVVAETSKAMNVIDAVTACGAAAVAAVLAVDATNQRRLVGT